MVDQATLWSIIGSIVIVLGFLGGMIYWMGNVQTKMDMMITILGEIKGQLISQGADIRSLEHRVQKLEDERK